MPWTSDLRSQETLPAIVNRMAKADPRKEFLRTVDGASATWEQLQEAMILWAARFLALDVKKGDVVVTLLDAGLDSLAAWLGLSSIGATDAATNPEFRGRMLAYAINNCQSRTPHRGGTILAVRGGRRGRTAIRRARPRSGC